MHRRNGALIELRNHWLIAAHYPDEPRDGGNALVDFAHRPTWELIGPDVARTLTDLCGHDVAVRPCAPDEAGPVLASDDGSWPKRRRPAFSQR